MRVRKYPFCVAGQYVDPWFVGSVCEASNSVFFSDGFQVESVAVMWERSVCATGSWLSDCRPQKEGTRKNSSWEEEGINALSQFIGQWVTISLGGGHWFEKGNRSVAATVLKIMHKYVKTDKIYKYYSMNKQYVEGLQKQEKVYIIMMDSKMTRAMLTLLFTMAGQELMSLLFKGQKQKRMRMGFWTVM